MVQSINTNLILSQVDVEDVQWKTANEYFLLEELEYMNETLLQMTTQEYEKQSKLIPIINYSLTSNDDVTQVEKSGCK